VGSYKAKTSRVVDVGRRQGRQIERRTALRCVRNCLGQALPPES